MEGLVWYILHNTLQIQQQKIKTFIQFTVQLANTILLSTQNKGHWDSQPKWIQSNWRGIEP